MTKYPYPSSDIAKEGTHLDAAAAVKKAVSLPVVSGGRILTPAFADQAIADGRCDMVFVARSVIADPEWPNKCRDDQTSEIRSEEHTSELQSLMRISYDVFCLKKKNKKNEMNITHRTAQSK